MNAAVETVESDERGLVVSCASCGKRNRMNYEQLGRVFRCGQCHRELPACAEPVPLTEDRAFSALIGRSALAVLVDFWAAWCGPCKMLAPELVKVAGMGAGRWLVAKVNTEELPSLARDFGINSIPTLVLFQGGREIERQAGAMPAAAIRQFIERAARV